MADVIDLSVVSPIHVVTLIKCLLYLCQQCFLELFVYLLMHIHMVYSHTCLPTVHKLTKNNSFDCAVDVSTLVHNYWTLASQL